MSHTVLVVIGGLLIGLIFGVAGQRSGFCLMGGLRDWQQQGDSRRLRAFALAAAVAIAGTQLLVAAEVVSLEQSLYLQPGFSWLLVPLGGLLFGYGMTLANGCGARALVLLGSGNLRSFVVLVCLGISGHMTLSGLFAPARVWLGGWTTVAHLSGADMGMPVWMPGLLLVGVLMVFVLADSEFRASRRDWLGGIVIGALVPAGWLVTAYLGADDFEPVRVASLTFVAPIGDSLQYAMLFTGTRLDFGVAVVIGVIAGALIGALASRSFVLQGYTSPEGMLRSMSGGALMGVGGVLALGCSIGQGLTGLSTLASSSLLAIVAIVIGAKLAQRGSPRLAAQQEQALSG